MANVLKGKIIKAIFLNKCHSSPRVPTVTSSQGIPFAAPITLNNNNDKEKHACLGV